MGKRVPIPITGPAYTHPIQEVSQQRCVNMYLSYPNAMSDLDKGNALEQGRGNGVLIPTMGNEILTPTSGSWGSGVCRGIFTVFINHNQAYTFYVFGNRLVQQYNILNPGSYTTNIISGTFPDTTGNVVMTCNQQYLMITKSDYTGSSKWAYYYDYTVSVGTGTVTQITDTDFVGGTHVVMIDGYFIVNKPNSSTLQASDLNTPINWTATNVAQTNGYPDNLVGLGQTKNELWAFGANSIEVWYDAANNPGFPFSKRVGSDMGIGCAAPYSIVTANDKIYWIDSRCFVAQSDFSSFFRNQSSGYQIAKVSTEAIDAEFNSYSIVNDAVGSSYLDRGHVMIEWNFPTQGTTWVLDTTTNLWHEKASINTATKLLQANNICYYTTVGRKVYGGSQNTSHIYELRKDLYLDDAKNIPRIRTTQVWADNFNEITVNELEIKCRTGRAAPVEVNTVTQILATTVVGWAHSGSITVVYFADPIQNYTTQAELNAGSTVIYLYLYGTVNAYQPTLTTPLYNPTSTPPPTWYDAATLVSTYGYSLVGTGSNNALYFNLFSNPNAFLQIGGPCIMDASITALVNVNPYINMTYSNDSGYTWSNSMPRGLGKLGEYNKRITWGPWGSAREWTLEMRVDDAVDFAIIDASANIDSEQTS